MKEAGLKVKGKKCVFGTSNIEFLGHNVSEKGITPSTKKVEVIAQMIPPRSLNEVMSVVGLFSYYRRFVKDFGTIAAPLYHLIVEKGGSKKNSESG